MGNYVVVQHPNGSHTRYAHCEGVTTTVGSRVSAGEQIATVGSDDISKNLPKEFMEYIR